MAQIIQDARYVMVTPETETMTQLYGTPWVRRARGHHRRLAVTSVVYFRRKSPSLPRRPEWPPPISVRHVSKDFVLPHLR